MKWLSNLKLGKGGSLKSAIKEDKRVIKDKKEKLEEIKFLILDLNNVKEDNERAVQINGGKFFLNLKSDEIIEELNARRRFFDRDLEDLMVLLSNIDNYFLDTIKKIDIMMKKNNFATLWSAFLINIEHEELALRFNRIVMTEMNYSDAEKKMMKMSIDRLYPENVHMKIAKKMHFRGKIYERIERSQIRRVRKDRYFFKNLEDLFLYFDTFDSNQFETFLNNFSRILEIADSGSVYGMDTGTKLDYEELYSLILLALNNNPEKITFFLQKFEGLQSSSKFFAAACSLLPWDSEEIWETLIRAESTILRAQIASFIPELMEYGLLLSMSPTLISLTNGLSELERKRWHYLLLPIFHMMLYEKMEDQIVKYVESRPLAYMIALSMRRRSSILHFHTTG